MKHIPEAPEECVNAVSYTPVGSGWRIECSPRFVRDDSSTTVVEYLGPEWSRQQVEDLCTHMSSLVTMVCDGVAEELESLKDEISERDASISVMKARVTSFLAELLGNASGIVDKIINRPLDWGV